MNGNHIFLTEDNAEETIEHCLMYIKSKTSSESRSKAFTDCTNYWTEKVEEILKDNCPNGAKLSRIRQLFNIKPFDE